MSVSHERKEAQARYMRAVRTGTPEQADGARRSYYTEVLKDRIKKALAEAPPLSGEQLAELRTLLDVPPASAT